MLKLFISYRRKSWPFARKLADELRQLFDAEIFIDLNSIDETDFELSILRNLRESSAVLLIVSSETFTERIHRDDDWVRREIREALRLNKPIVLACADGLLPPDDLPDDIKAIRGKEGTRFFPEFFDAGVAQLAAFIDRATPIKLKPPITTASLPVSPAAAPRKMALKLLVTGAIALMALLSGALGALFSSGRQNATQVTPPTVSAQAVAMIASETASVPINTVMPTLPPTNTATFTPIPTLLVTPVIPVPTNTPPTPTLTFTAAIQGAGILFQDTFIDNSHNWGETQNKMGIVALADGALTIKTLQSEQTVWVYPSVTFPSDVDVSVTAQAIKPDRNKDWFYGLGIRGRTVGNSIDFYYFKMCGSGNWEFGVSKAGVLLHIADENLQDFDNAAATTLRIRAVRNHLEFYINTLKVWTAEDIKLDTVKTNRIVLIGGTHLKTFSQLVRFTNLRVVVPTSGR